MADTTLYIKDASGNLVPVDVRQAPDGDRRQVVILGDGENAGVVSPATEETLALLLTELTAKLEATSANQDAAKADLDAISAAAGTTADTGDTIIGRLKAIASAVATTATNFLAVRLTDGAGYLGVTSGRLHVADGGVAIHTDGSGVTQPTAPTVAGDVVTALVDGRKTVTTPGTAVALRGSLACKWVQATALKENQGQVNVGGSDVLAAAGSYVGSPLDPGQSVTIPVSNANLVYVDARVAGDGVCFVVGS
jgi:hypothetical protein